MKSLRSFLLEEARIHEGDENSEKPKDDTPKPEKRPAPSGYTWGSTKGGITKEGQAIMKQLTGEDDSGKAISFSKIRLDDAKEIKKKAGFGSVGSLEDLMKKMISGSSEGAQAFQEVFRKMTPGPRGVGGHEIELASGWDKLARRQKSSEKVLMFWVNTLYNVYLKGTNKDKIKLKFLFSDDMKTMVVDEP